MTDKIFVNRQFINDIRQKNNTLIVFKMFYSYWGLMEDETIESLKNKTPAEMQELFNYEGGLQPGSTEKRENPWYYPGVYIDDDIIKVKLVDPVIRNWYSLFFVYDKITKDVNGEVKIENNLAFIVETMNDDATVENYAENYFEFSLKSISGVSCKFLTYTKAMADSAGIKYEINGYTEKVLHEHRNDVFSKKETMIINVTSWKHNSIIGFYYCVIPDDKLYRIIYSDCTFNTGNEPIYFSDTNWDENHIETYGTGEDHPFIYVKSSNSENWYIGINGNSKDKIIFFTGETSPKTGTLYANIYDSNSELVDFYELEKDIRTKLKETSETTSSRHLDRAGRIIDNGVNIINKNGENFEKKIGVSAFFDLPDSIVDACISYIDKPNK